MSLKPIFAFPKKVIIIQPAISASCNSVGISDVNADWFANRFISRLFQLKLQLGKEAESDPELLNYIWNGFDAKLLDNYRMELTNKARLEYINSTCGGMCINRMLELKFKFNNQFKSILSKPIVCFALQFFSPFNVLTIFLY